MAAGGEILEELLRKIFLHTGIERKYVIGGIKGAFPSEQAFISLVIFGLVLFFVLRYYNIKWIKNIITAGIFIIWILIGVSNIYLGYEYPSDVISGYVFGAAWLGFNIVFLEVSRILPEIEEIN